MRNNAYRQTVDRGGRKAINKLNKQFPGLKQAIKGQMGIEQGVAQQNINMNRPTTETNPYGTKTYTQNEDGTFSAETKLSEAEQAKYDQQNQFMGGLGQYINNTLLPQLQGRGSLDFSGAPQVPGQGDLMGERQRIEDGIYNRFRDRMSPQFDRERESFEQRMADRGVPVGSELYNKQLEEMNRRQQDTLLDAQTRALETGGTEMTRSHGIGMANRQQSIGETMQMHNQPLQDLQGAGGMWQGSQGPGSFTPFQAVGMNAPSTMAGVQGFGNYQLGGQANAIQAERNQIMAQQGGGGQAPGQNVTFIPGQGGGSSKPGV